MTFKVKYSMKSKFENIDRKKLKKNIINIIVFVLIFYILSKWNTIEEFFKSYF